MPSELSSKVRLPVGTWRLHRPKLPPRSASLSRSAAFRRSLSRSNAKSSMRDRRVCPHHKPLQQSKARAAYKAPLVIAWRCKGCKIALKSRLRPITSPLSICNSTGWMVRMAIRRCSPVLGIVPSNTLLVLPLTICRLKKVPGLLKLVPSILALSGKFKNCSPSLWTTKPHTSGAYITGRKMLVKYSGSSVAITTPANSPSDPETIRAALTTKSLRNDLYGAETYKVVRLGCDCTFLK